MATDAELRPTVMPVAMRSGLDGENDRSSFEGVRQVGCPCSDLGQIPLDTKHQIEVSGLARAGNTCPQAEPGSTVLPLACVSASMLTSAPDRAERVRRRS